MLRFWAFLGLMVWFGLPVLLCNPGSHTVGRYRLTGDNESPTQLALGETFRIICHGVTRVVGFWWRVHLASLPLLFARSKQEDIFNVDAQVFSVDQDRSVVHGSDGASAFWRWVSMSTRNHFSRLSYEYYFDSVVQVGLRHTIVKCIMSVSVLVMEFSLGS